jgi:hypothetical protein
VWGASSFLLATTRDLSAVVAAEHDFDRVVGERFATAGRRAPDINVCVYAEADLRNRPTDPLATIVALLDAHPLVAHESASGVVTVGAEAIAAILKVFRPPETAAAAWRDLAGWAAATLGRRSAT